MSIHVSSEVRENVCVCVCMCVCVCGGGGHGAWLRDVTAVCSVNADGAAEDGAEEEKTRRCLTPLNDPSPILRSRDTHWHFLLVSIFLWRFSIHSAADTAPRHPPSVCQHRAGWDRLLKKAPPPPPGEPPLQPTWMRRITVRLIYPSSIYPPTFSLVQPRVCAVDGGMVWMDECATGMGADGGVSRPRCWPTEDNTADLVVTPVNKGAFHLETAAGQCVCSQVRGICPLLHGIMWRDAGDMMGKMLFSSCNHLFHVFDVLLGGFEVALAIWLLGLKPANWWEMIRYVTGGLSRQTYQPFTKTCPWNVPVNNKRLRHYK